MPCLPSSPLFSVIIVVTTVVCIFSGDGFLTYFVSLRCFLLSRFFCLTVFFSLLRFIACVRIYTYILRIYMVHPGMLFCLAFFACWFSPFAVFFVALVAFFFFFVGFDAFSLFA